MSRKELMGALVSGGFWFESGVPGVVGRSDRFESLVRGFEAIVFDLSQSDGAERVAFPPIVDRDLLRRVNYMESFPELCGSVHSFRKSRGSHLDLVDRVDNQGDWTEFLDQQPLALCPAACYPVYPTCAGKLQPDGRTFNLTSYVFRSEPSGDPARLQSFRQHENVRIGRPEAVRDWRKLWIERASGIYDRLGLPFEIAVVSDPFFGRGGRLLAEKQVAEELKFEVLVPITSSEEPTAITSFNYHEDKFARVFGIEGAEGEPAHSACVGFGLERIILALLVAHGMDARAWPASVREAMSL